MTPLENAHNVLVSCDRQIIKTARMFVSHGRRYKAELRYAVAAQEAAHAEYRRQLDLDLTVRMIISEATAKKGVKVKPS